MLRKLAGWCTGLLALGCAMFTVMFAVDLIGGGSPTSPGVLTGLVVFFGGLTAATGVGARKLLKGTAQEATPLSVSEATAMGMPGVAVDIALEAQILRLAQQSDGKVTAAEVAIACGVPLDQASAALDSLLRRGHADLHTLADGETVHVIKGIVSAAEKAQSVDVLARERR